MRQSRASVYAATIPNIASISIFKSASATRKTTTTQPATANFVTSANHPINGSTLSANLAPVPNVGKATSALVPNPPSGTERPVFAHLPEIGTAAAASVPLLKSGTANSVYVLLPEFGMARAVTALPLVFGTVRNASAVLLEPGKTENANVLLTKFGSTKNVSVLKDIS
jgi:hypothetical protein